MNRKMLMLRILFMNGYKRAKYLKKISYFHRQGNNCYFQPINFGTEPHLIEFGDNVLVASGVRFVNHDIASFIFNSISEDGCFPTRVGKVIIGNNVFIGCNTIILYDVTIGDNVIIGAGSVVTKDIPHDSVAAGVPAKVIGTFEEYRKKYLEIVGCYSWDAKDDPNKKKKQIDFFFGSDKEENDG